MKMMFESLEKYPSYLDSGILKLNVSCLKFSVFIKKIQKENYNLDVKLIHKFDVVSFTHSACIPLSKCI